MPSARWGESVWSEERFGEAEGGVAHILEANFGAAAQASASRLAFRHPIAATIQSRLIAVGVGAGPGAVHPLRAIIAVSGAAADAKSLSFRHQMAATFIAALISAPTPLRMGHKLAAEAIASLEADAFSLSLRHPLLATIIAHLEAAATDLDLSHPLAATFIVELEALARYALDMPTVVSIAELDPDDPTTLIAGGVNLHLNWSAENGLLGWFGEHNGIVSLALLPSRDGLYSVAFSSDGSDPDARMVARSASNLALVPIGGSLAWGQAFLAAPAPIDVLVWTRARYSDGTLSDGEVSGTITIDATGLLSDWENVLAPALTLDDTKTLEAIDFVVAPANPASAAEFWIDTVILEYDSQMTGPEGWLPSGIPVPPQEGEDEAPPPGEGL